MDWYKEESSNILNRLGSRYDGLSINEVETLRSKFGKNKLPEEKQASYLEIFLDQFRSPLIYVLVLAVLIVSYLGEYTDASIILFVLILNAVVGTFQEGKAKEKLASLRVLTETRATVLRDKKERIINAEELVPGDIVVLKEGDQVPADARVILVNSLSADEASLTGESTPVSKIVEPIAKPKLEVSDQKNMIWKGTYILSGYGKAIVVEIGESTVIGKLATKLKTAETEVPLKTGIKNLTRVLIIAMVVIIVGVFFLAISKGNPIEEVFKMVVALAVSFIPEGLPVVVTLILASGVSRMGEKNALVKKLQAVEALGQADVLAIDKTGTLTKNQMMVQRLYANGGFFQVSGSGYEPVGSIKAENSLVEPLNHTEILLLGRISLLTATASIAYDEDKKEWHRVSGEPTEVALMVFGQKLGFNKSALEQEIPRKAEIPFDSHIKYHASVHEVDGSKELYIAGAPEVILNSTRQIWKEGKCQILLKEDGKILESALKDISSKGLRVLALATASNISLNFDPIKPPPLCFVGFVGIADVMRPSAKDSIMQARAAGLKVVMITGDYKDTAKAIAKETGIFNEGDYVITGKDLESLSEEELLERIDKTSVFARVSPEHKLKIIELFKKKGKTIAMTGDGVNDALSLVAADLGVSMGKSGTEVAKEASDIVLLDDNLGSVIEAVEEGRNIYRSIRKVILYLLGTAVGEILAISGAIALGLEIPLTPGQIIWLNLVTDGFLVVALGLEPREKGLLLGKMKKSGKYLIDKLIIERVLFMGIVMSIITLVMFEAYLDQGIVKASTVALTVLSMTQWFNVWNARSTKKSLFYTSWVSNPFIIYALVVVVILQILVVHTPFLQDIFRTTALSFNEWMVIALVSSIVLVAEELRKVVRYSIPEAIRRSILGRKA